LTGLLRNLKEVLAVRPFSFIGICALVLAWHDYVAFFTVRQRYHGCGCGNVNRRFVRQIISVIRSGRFLSFVLVLDRFLLLFESLIGHVVFFDLLGRYLAELGVVKQWLVAEEPLLHAFHRFAGHAFVRLVLLGLEHGHVRHDFVFGIAHHVASEERVGDVIFRWNGAERPLWDKVTPTPVPVLTQRGVEVLDTDTLQRPHAVEPAAKFVLLHERADKGKVIREPSKGVPDIASVDIRKALAQRLHALAIAVRDRVSIDVLHLLHALHDGLSMHVCRDASSSDRADGSGPNSHKLPGFPRRVRP